MDGTLNQIGLIKKLVENKGRFASVTSVTDARPLRKSKIDKKLNPFEKGRLLRRTKQQHNPMADYQKAVQRQQERLGLEADYKASFRRNGSKAINGLPLAVHPNGNCYLRVVNPSIHHSYLLDAETGNEVPFDAVAEFFADKKNKRQEKAGIEKKDQIQYRDITLDNIVEITIGRQTYAVRP